MSDDLEARLIQILGSHPGRDRAIGAADLYERLYGRPCRDKIRDTRPLRKLVTRLKEEEGYPILSTSDSEDGGYYLATEAAEIEEYCKRLDRQGRRKLWMAAKIRKRALPGHCGQMRLE